jgi:N-acetylglucosaminyldiphosphoundecaprenol N-acetyl-beta-D-mannosaminyltransferase
MRLQAPVLSHLGAVVNFVAGRVERAPPWLQRVGLEWVWRIKEEPALWRRYAADGLRLATLIATRVLPSLVQSRLSPPKPHELRAASVGLYKTEQGAALRLAGAWTHANLAPLRSAFAEAADMPLALHVDASELAHIDSAVIALLGLLWSSRVENGRPWQVVGTRRRVARQLRYACAEYLLQPHGTAQAAVHEPELDRASA